MNHMAEVAKLLGVELGERFKLVCADGDLAVEEWWESAKEIYDIWRKTNI